MITHGERAKLQAQYEAISADLCATHRKWKRRTIDTVMAIRGAAHTIRVMCFGGPLE